MSLSVSVIIPVWNGRPFLAECLDSLFAQGESALEVIAVDNASSDGSADFIAQHYPQVHLVRNARNLGFSGGCNVGLRQARGEVLVLLNQDAHVQSGWLAALNQAFATHPAAGIVGGQGWYPDRKRVQHAGGWVDWPLGYARHYGYGATEAGEWGVARQVEFVTGAAMAIRRTVIESIGLLDEGFWPGYFEDIDYCLRARQAGFEVWYWPGAAFVHHESKSVEAAALSEYYQRGRLRLVLKHLPPARFLAEFVPAENAHYSSAIRGQQSRPLRRAYLEVSLALPAIIAERWPDENDKIDQLGAALQQLYRQVWSWQALSEAARAEVPLPVGAVPAEADDLWLGYLRLVESRRAPASTPGFKEYQFRSGIPVIGPLLVWLRTLWFRMAARWALLYVLQQQEAMNHRFEAALRELTDRVQDLAEDNLWLMTRLALRRPQPEGNPDDERRA